MTLDERIRDYRDKQEAWAQAARAAGVFYVPEAPENNLIMALIADHERLKEENERLEKALWTAYEMLVADQDPYHVVCEAIDMEVK